VGHFDFFSVLMKPIQLLLVPHIDQAGENGQVDFPIEEKTC
jgi:hypothetical protein